MTVRLLMWFTWTSLMPLTLSPHILVQKLAAHDLDGCMLSWVKHWLDGRAQRAVDNAVKHIWWLVTSGAPRARYWDHFYLASLLKILMRGLSAPSVNLQMTPSWEGVLICLRGETHFRGTWIDWINRPGQTVWVSIGPSVGSCISVTMPGNPTGLGRSGWKAA